MCALMEQGETKLELVLRWRVSPGFVWTFDGDRLDFPAGRGVGRVEEQNSATAEVERLSTSKPNRLQASSLRIPLSDLDSYSEVNQAIDGADEVDPDLNLVKGRGRSQLKQKLLRRASLLGLVWITDESKYSSTLEQAEAMIGPEIAFFGWKLTHARNLK
ncbi:Probable ribose-5-phosphate isomerase 2 [Linum grandiflorum]